MRTVSGDSLSKGDKMSQVETFPRPHNANRQLAEHPPNIVTTPPPSPKLKSKRWGDTEAWMAKKERKDNEIIIVLTYKFHLSV